jgi:anti-sigma regulatory factor (Ser/Thr protein kinase)/Fe-S-cluster-containing hydrogenase component 2
VEHLSYPIESGDYAGAGAASRDLKRHLKRIGAEADAVRRAMIAAYEAEMNVVIHTAAGGRLDAIVTSGQLDVDVVDNGPGIPDVDAAMREGFSTASAEARALGFGAGMGLPNIARNSDRVTVSSTVGGGTTVSFTIALRPDAAVQGAPVSSLSTLPEVCRDCRHCLLACPTAALRVRDGRPSVLHHLCVDCTSCIGVCAPEALTLLDAAGPLECRGVLAVPPALLAGFGDHPAATVLAELRALGFDEVVSVHSYEDALRRRVLDLAATSALPEPVISPVCPAAVSLVELRFPALVPHLAPLASPWEAVQRELDGRDATFVVSCPSQRSALLAQLPTDQRRTVTPRRVREAVLPRLTARHDGAGERPEAPWPQASGADDLLVVDGVAHVTAVLEQIEDGVLSGVSAVEPYLCDGGCFGSPLLAEDARVAAWRWAAAAGLPGEGRSVERARPYRPRPGVRLDDDMAVAIRKLGELDVETRALPGKDCGVCGAPTCAALAEDIVMSRSTRAACPYVTTEEGSDS